MNKIIFISTIIASIFLCGCSGKVHSVNHSIGVKSINTHGDFMGRHQIDRNALKKNDEIKTGWDTPTVGRVVNMTDGATVNFTTKF